MEVLLVIALVLFCPLAAGKIASDKGRTAVLWGVFGFFLGIFGVLLAARAEARRRSAVAV